MQDESQTLGEKRTLGFREGDIGRDGDNSLEWGELNGGEEMDNPIIGWGL